MSGNIIFTRWSAADLDEVDALMVAAFDPEYGEAWTRGQLDAEVAVEAGALRSPCLCLRLVAHRTAVWHDSAALVCHAVGRV